MAEPANRPGPEPAPAPFELQAMAQAVNYYSWLAEHFLPQLSGCVLEHGSGTGLLSERLHAAGVAPIILTEPDTELAGGLRKKFAGLDHFEIFEGTIETFVAARGAGVADAIISANVLEHVEHDEACLKEMWRALKPGGHLCLYVPARPELFGSLDRAFHHHRRFRRAELREKLVAAGFTVRELLYRNIANALPWWLMGRVLHRKTLSLRSIRFYDRWCFPWLRRIEDLTPVPYGVNLLALAQKPAAG
jgi:SAM-dependent methyltransferase